METHLEEDTFKIFPIDKIKSFGEIKFVGTEGVVSSFMLLNGMEAFKGHQGVVGDELAWNEGTLGGRDNII